MEFKDLFDGTVHETAFKRWLQWTQRFGVEIPENAAEIMSDIQQKLGGSSGAGRAYSYTEYFTRATWQADLPPLDCVRIFEPPTIHDVVPSIDDVVPSYSVGPSTGGRWVSLGEYREACMSKEGWDALASRMGWDEEWTAEDEHFTKTVLPSLFDGRAEGTMSPAGTGTGAPSPNYWAKTLTSASPTPLRDYWSKAAEPSKQEAALPVRDYWSQGPIKEKPAPFTRDRNHDREP